jgi:type II secretory pathway pseudopilin PulG
MVALLVLASVLAAAAVSNLDRLGDTQSSVASRQLLRDLAYARQRAVATGTVTWVTFDDAAETWSILAEDPLNPGRTNATPLTDLVTGQPFVQTLGTGVYGNVGIVSADFDTDVEVGFNWKGQPLAATEASLVAEGVVLLTGGHAIRVAVDTGYAVHDAP